MEIQKEIDRIEARLEAKKITVERFCGKAGVHPTTWCRWKRGKMPSLRMWNKIVEAEKSLPV
ncbi:helix-turn-helix transcriptional regulator [Thalassospira sp. TSL5-1]|uniref:helix-turn-helix domain-containing protein n=1 Tax=Thalassospira sp. TSL5-1 TaxID=1544451 RepID=UPI00093E59F7|nr:helix-turn-helix transcriptional regulator [Thalassospira sp. TSL5-1]OKH89225.1 hypothetical protein LF95_04140 [Thalassospira sp. TSL5-1]